MWGPDISYSGKNAGNRNSTAKPNTLRRVSRARSLLRSGTISSSRDNVSSIFSARSTSSTPSTFTIPSTSSIPSMPSVGGLSTVDSESTIREEFWHDQLKNKTRERPPSKAHRRAFSAGDSLALGLNPNHHEFLRGKPKIEARETTSPRRKLRAHSPGSNTLLALPKCKGCDNFPGTVCRFCDTKSYCSTACQKRLEPMHEFVCRQRAEFLSRTKRSPDNSNAIFRLAALFLGDSQSLQFVWLEVVKGCGEDRNSVPKLQEYLEGPYNDFKLDAKKRTSGAKLDYHLRIWGRVFPPSSGTPTHKGTEVDEILQGKTKRLWRATPLVITKCTDINANSWSYNDIVPEDIQLVAKYYIERGGHMEQQSLFQVKEPVPASSEDLSLAVRISCSGDVASLKKAKLNSVIIDKGEDLEPSLSDISVLLGFPLALRKVAAAPHWYSKRATLQMGYGSLPLFNLMAQKLMTCVDPEDGTNWGFSNMEVWGLPGPVIVNRLDCKPLFTYHIAVLVDFIDKVLTPAMMITAEIDGYVERLSRTDYVKVRDLRHGYDDNVVEKRKWIIRKMMCREIFEKYFEKYKKWKIEKGNVLWANARSPYEV